jgi:hypothetical protein
MSWEAFRLTSKSPTELYAVMGPAGVDALVRQALQECWTSLPDDRKTYTDWKRRAEETFARNRKVWTAIKRPTPAAFFEKMAPFASDGHLRQAMILCWMMMPRAGGRDFKDVVKLMDRIFQRNMDAWKQDNAAFTIAPKQKKKPKALTKPIKKPKKRKAKR